jgi:putative DNA primase/helicase
MIQFATSLRTNKRECQHLPVNELIDYLHNTKRVEAYEIIDENDIHKPYFDLDGYCDDKPTSDYISDLLQPIINELQTIYKTKTYALRSSNGIVDDKYKLSYHIIIPKLITNRADNKHVAEYLKNKFGAIIDTSVYKPYQKLRLPYSYKNGERRCKPINGTDKDHIVTYVNDCKCTWKNDLPAVEKPCNKKQKNNKQKKQTYTEQQELRDIITYDSVKQCDKCDIQHINKLLQIISPNRVNDYTDWVSVGMILYNVSNANDEYLEAWNTWSKQSHKYAKNECFNKWNTFTHTADNQLTVATLHYWAKIDNITEYNKMTLHDCMIDFIDKNHQQLAIKNKDIELVNIVNNKTKCMAKINDVYCNLAKREHDEANNFIDILYNYGAYIGCHHEKCQGKVLNDNVVKIDARTNNILFQNNGDVNINITNINNMDKDDTLLITDSYEIFDDIELNKLILESLNNTPYDIAKVLHYLYRDRFNCTKDKVWYTYCEHRWLKDSVDIRDIISNELPAYYKIVLTYYKELINDSRENRAMVECKIKKIIELIKSLKRTPSKQNIITESCEIFYKNNKTFEKNLNTKPHLLCFTNGIYDLDNDEFRDGRYDDNITISTGYEYIDAYSKHKDKLFAFLNDIQPEKEQLEYLLKFTASVLYGCNTIELFHILSGSSRNGKSKYAELLSHVFGEYCEFITSTLLTKEQPSANNPRPEILTLIGKRLIISSEPENNAKLNANFIKLLTGNDNITARNLYDSNIISFIPQFSMMLLCNDIPSFDKNDDAIWQRSRCIEFPSKFVNNPTESHHKLIDYKLKQKLPKWKNDMMLLLLDNYRTYKRDGLTPTKSVLRFTVRTRDENDIYKQYLDERTERSDKHIHLYTLYEDFKRWVSVINPSFTKHSSKTLSKGIGQYVTVEKVYVSQQNSSAGVKNIKIKNTNINNIFEP